jgi:uncharacterized small protein (DUF1192 family)
MNLQDKVRIEELERRATKNRHVLEGLIPVWNQVDRRVKDLQAEIQRCEDERMKLQQGQLSMSFDEFNF